MILDVFTIITNFKELKLLYHSILNKSIGSMTGEICIVE